MLVAYATVLAFALVASAFVFASLLVGRAFRPRPPAETQGAKLGTYESGEEPVTPAWFNYNPRFYVMALVFLIFDVEIALVFPVVVVFKRWVLARHGALAAAELFGFVGILLLGLAYVWRKGDLEWVRSIDGAAPEGAELPVARSRAGASAAAAGRAGGGSEYP